MDHAYETEAPVFPRVLQPPNDLASLRLSIVVVRFVGKSSARHLSLKLFRKLKSCALHGIRLALRHTGCSAECRPPDLICRPEGVVQWKNTSRSVRNE